MRQSADQILTAAQMRSAEEALIAAGTSVDELMQRAGRGAAEWVWRVAAHAAAALEALHAARVIHMDVKPENIYLDWEEKEKEESKVQSSKKQG